MAATRPQQLLLLILATTARCAAAGQLQVLPCNATNQDMHWQLDAGAHNSLSLKLASADTCADCAGAGECTTAPCPQERSKNTSFYFTQTATGAPGNFTLTRGSSCVTATTGGIGSAVALRDCSAGLNGNNVWHYDAATNLLHNNAVQFSQKFSLCLTAPDSSPVTPPAVIATLSIDTTKTAPLDHYWSACVGSSRKHKTNPPQGHFPWTDVYLVNTCRSLMDLTDLCSQMERCGSAPTGSSTSQWQRSSAVSAKFAATGSWTR